MQKGLIAVLAVVALGAGLWVYNGGRLDNILPTKLTSPEQENPKRRKRDDNERPPPHGKKPERWHQGPCLFKGDC